MEFSVQTPHPVGLLTILVGALILTACSGGAPDDGNGAVPSGPEQAAEQPEEQAAEQSAEPAEEPAAEQPDTAEFLAAALLDAGFLDLISGSLIQDFTTLAQLFVECRRGVDCDRRGELLLPVAFDLVRTADAVLAELPVNHPDPEIREFSETAWIMASRYLLLGDVALAGVQSNDSGPLGVHLREAIVDLSRLAPLLIEAMSVLNQDLPPASSTSFFDQFDRAYGLLNLGAVNQFAIALNESTACETDSACASADRSLANTLGPVKDDLGVARETIAALEPTLDIEETAQQLFLEALDDRLEAVALLEQFISTGDIQRFDDALEAMRKATRTLQELYGLLAENRESR